MRAVYEYLATLMPAGLALLLFSAFHSTIQMDHLGSGIAVLLTLVGMGLASLFWLGALISILRRPVRKVPSGENSGLPGLITYLGLLCAVPAFAALIARYAVVEWDPYRMHAFNWPYLAWLSAVSGTELFLSGLVLSRR